MDAFWRNIWKSFPVSPWSAVLYLSLSWWASKKLPSNAYSRIAWLASWVDALCILGVLVLVGDILWLSMSWLRWGTSYSEEVFSYILLPLARNIAMIVICILLMNTNWLRVGYIHFSREVTCLIGLNILYIFLCFCLAPGKEWTHWIYALENKYNYWPVVWFITYPVGRAITSLIYVKMWSGKHAS